MENISEINTVILKTIIIIDLGTNSHKGVVDQTIAKVELKS